MGDGRWVETGGEGNEVGGLLTERGLGEKEEGLRGGG